MSSPDAPLLPRRPTVAVRVGGVTVGGGAPVVVQSMTNTDTADAAGTARQCIELAAAGSELVRITVNVDEAARAVPEIKRRMLAAGCTAPLVGDFHYNGHVLLTRFPECAAALDKYRINPGNVGFGSRRDDQFSTIVRLAAEHGKAVRIGVNGGSLDQALVMAKMEENTRHELGKSSEEILADCMVISALDSAAQAIALGLGEDRIVISCKVSRPADLLAVYRRLAEGIGDTIRISLTPRPGGDRREEVYAACELLQSLGLRSFSPAITACPGCGRTTSTTFQELAERIQGYVRERMPEWKRVYPGVEELRLAVMGCVVNGPGESRAAHIGISLPGTGEAPHCPVFIDGQPFAKLRGTYGELAEQFQKIVEDYVAVRWGGGTAAAVAAADPVPAAH